MLNPIKENCVGEAGYEFPGGDEEIIARVTGVACSNDGVDLPKSGGFKYFIQGHCSLMHFPEYHSLHAETMKTIRDWIFKDILC